MRLFILLAFLIFFSDFHSQIRFNFSMDSKPLLVGEKYFNQTDSSWIQIDDLKFYVVYNPFFSDESTAGSSVIHLVDLNDSTSWSIPFTEDGMKESNNFEFAIGLDSATTISTQFSGALDPSFGMYWAWNTGYIHFKLEGKSNLVPSSKNEFQYHIGGYSGKFETQRWISAPIKLKNLKPIVQLELADFIREILNLKEKPLLMIPGKDAVFIADGYNKMFVK
jgi:hypothetical protein